MKLIFPIQCPGLITLQKCKFLKMFPRKYETFKVNAFVKFSNVLVSYTKFNTTLNCLLKGKN